MSYEEFKRKKLKKHGIEEDIWGQSLNPPCSMLYEGNLFTALYVLTDAFYEVWEGYFLRKYVLAEIKFRE